MGFLSQPVNDQHQYFRLRPSKPSLPLEVSFTVSTTLYSSLGLGSQESKIDNYCQDPQLWCLSLIRPPLGQNPEVKVWGGGIEWKNNSLK